MILTSVLLLALFHHKPKPQPLTPEQKQHLALIEEDKKIVLNGITGAAAYEADVKFAQYERPEIDAFEHQLFKCTHDTEDQLDADVDILIDLGNQLMALDAALHKEYAI